MAFTIADDDEPDPVTWADSFVAQQQSDPVDWADNFLASLPAPEAPLTLPTPPPEPLAFTMPTRTPTAPSFAPPFTPPLTAPSFAPTLSVATPPTQAFQPKLAARPQDPFLAANPDIANALDQYQQAQQQLGEAMQAFQPVLDMGAAADQDTRRKALQRVQAAQRAAQRAHQQVMAKGPVAQQYLTTPPAPSPLDALGPAATLAPYTAPSGLKLPPPRAVPPLAGPRAQPPVSPLDTLGPQATLSQFGYQGQPLAAQPAKTWTEAASQVGDTAKQIGTQIYNRIFGPEEKPTTAAATGPTTWTQRLDAWRRDIDAQSFNTMLSTDPGTYLTKPTISPQGQASMQSGVNDLGAGLATGDWDRAQGGAVNLIGGFFQSMQPAVLASFATAPVRTAIAVGATATADKLVYEGVKKTGASENTARLSGLVASLVTGGVAVPKVYEGVDWIQKNGININLVPPEVESTRIAPQPSDIPTQVIQPRGLPVSGGLPGEVAAPPPPTEPLVPPEPPTVTNGMVRLYAPDVPGIRDFTSDPNYAAYLANLGGNGVAYVDVPADHPLVNGGPNTPSVAQGVHDNVTLPADIADQRQPLMPDTPPPQAPAAAAAAPPSAVPARAEPSGLELPRAGAPPPAPSIPSPLTPPPAVAQAAPRVAVKNRTFSLGFNNPVDQALYLVSKPGAAETHAPVLRWLSDLTGKSGGQVQEMGMDLADTVKAYAKNAPPEATHIPIPPTPTGLMYLQAAAPATGWRTMRAQPRPTAVSAPSAAPFMPPEAVTPREGESLADYSRRVEEAGQPAPAPGPAGVPAPVTPREGESPAEYQQRIDEARAAFTAAPPQPGGPRGEAPVTPEAPVAPRPADLGGPGRPTGGAEGAVRPPAGAEGGAAPVEAAAPVPAAAPAAVARNPAVPAEAVATMLRGEHDFAKVPIETTPQGEVIFRRPTGEGVVSTIRPASEMTPDFTQQASWDSLHAELEARNKKKTYFAQGANHPLPKTAAAFAALPASHQQAIQKRFVQAGIYHPATDTISINADFAHDPDVWAEEWFHAGAQRLTPAEREAGLWVGDTHYPLKTKAQEEEAFRAGLRIHPDVYGRSGAPGAPGEPSYAIKEKERERPRIVRPTIEIASHIIPDTPEIDAQRDEKGVLPRVLRAPYNFDPSTGRLELGVRIPDGEHAPALNAPTTSRMTDLYHPDTAKILPANKLQQLKEGFAQKALNLGVLSHADIAKTEGKPDARIKLAVQRMKENLRWLWNQTPAAIRERSKLWYVGAHRIAQGLSDQYGISHPQASALLAVLSPQTDWFQNVDLAKRVAKQYFAAEANNPVLDQEMWNQYEARTNKSTEDWVKKQKGKEAAGTRKTPFDEAAYRQGRADELAAEYKDNFNKPWSQLKDVGRAIVVRTLDERTDRSYYVVTPEGDDSHIAYNQDKVSKTGKVTPGKPSKVAWHSYDPIVKAVSVLRNGTPGNIDQMVGEQPKVRSFYNNIHSPHSPLYVTMDTHAAGAATLIPVSLNHPVVTQMFGGSPSSKPTGFAGTNPLIAEAYFQLAQELSRDEGRTILPREVQSVTWEAVRGLYEDWRKTDTFRDDIISPIHEDWRSGKISRGEFYKRIFKASDGIKPPDWYHGRPGVGAHEAELRAPDVHVGHAGGVPAERGAGVAGPERAGGANAPERYGRVGRATGPREEVEPSYAVRERPEPEPSGRLTFPVLQKEAFDQGISLAEAVERARAAGRDIDVSDYFNLGRVDVPPAEKEALKNSIIDTVVETGRVPKERISFDDIRREAQQLGGVDLVKELQGFGEAQPPYRAVRDAARHRINELNQQIYEERKAIDNLPASEQPERERAIAQKEQDVKQLLNVWMRMRSEDGRNLAMHGMMSDALGWDWTDHAYWLQRAKRELGLPHTVDLPDDVHQKVTEILGRGKAAQDAAARNVQDWLPIEPERGGAPPPVQGPIVPPAESRGPMTRQPPVQGPVLPPVESRGPMTRGAPVQGPVLPPVEPRGPMTRGEPVQGPVLPPRESRGPMTRGPEVQGPVLPPRESRGPMTRGPQVQGPVLPPLPPRRGRMTGRMPSPQEQAVQRELAQYLTKLNRTSFLDTIIAVRNAGLLTGIKTRIRNIGGHAAFLALEELSRVPASLVDMAIATKTGQRTVQGLSPQALGRSSYAAATKGVAEAGEVLRRGSAATPQEMLMYGAPRELNSGIPWLDAYVNYTRRSLTAPIRVMRSYAFQRSLEEQAALMARNSHGTQTAQELLAKPTEAMLVRAHADAEFATFSNPNMASQAFQQMVASFQRKGDMGKLMAFGAHIVVPFSQTPSNILARLIDYTPVGAGVRAGHAAYRAYVPGGGGAKPPGGGKPPGPPGTTAPEPSDDAQRAAKQLADKALSADQQRIFSMAIGRGMVGFALLYLGWQLAKRHLATGIAPDEPGARNVQQAAGQTPGAIKVGDKWRVVNTFAPVGSLITLGATAYERGASPEKEVVAAGKTIAETPMLSGARDISEALQSPDKSLTRWMGSTAGSFVPTAVSDVGALFDPYQRDARAQAALTAIKQGVQARVPGWRTQLPMRTDIFGQPVAAQKQAVWDPTLPQPDLSDDVTSELQAHDIGISTPQRAKPDLETDAEYRDRAAKIGDAIRIRLERLVRSPSYQSWTDDVQAKELEHAIRTGEASVPRPTEKRERALAAAGR